MSYMLVIFVVITVVLFSALLSVVIDIRDLLSRQVELTAQLERSTKEISQQLEAFGDLTTKLSKTRKEFIQGFKEPE